MFYKSLFAKVIFLLQYLNPRHWSITFKFSIAFLTVAIVPMSFVSFYKLRGSVDTLEKAEYKKLELIATSKANRLDQLIFDRQLTVKLLGTDSRIINFLKETFVVQKKTTPKIQNVLQTVFKSYENLDSIYIINQQGLCIASTEPSFINKNYAFREYFQEAIKGKAYISSILVGITTGRDGLFFSHPIFSDSGTIMGVVVLKTTGEQIRKLISSKNDSNATSFIVEENGIIISHSHQKYLYHSLIPLETGSENKIKTEKRYPRSKLQSLDIPELLVMKNAKLPGHTSYHLPLEDNQQMIGYAPLETQPWVLGFSQPKDIFLLPINNLIRQNIIFVLITGTSAVFIVLLFSHQITKPLKILTNVAQAMEEDKYDYQSLKLYRQLTKVSQTRDDIGQLIRVFIEMLEQVRTREQKMKLQIKELSIQIDESKKESQVYEITESKYFQEIQYQAQKLKNRVNIKHETEADYIQNLQRKVTLQRVKLQNSHNKNRGSKNV